MPGALGIGTSAVLLNAYPSGSPPAVNNLLLEDGSNYLLEDGSYILLE